VASSSSFEAHAEPQYVVITMLDVETLDSAAHSSLVAAAVYRSTMSLTSEVTQSVLDAVAAGDGAVVAGAGAVVDGASVVGEPGFEVSPPVQMVMAFCTSILLLTPLYVQSDSEVAMAAITAVQFVASQGQLKPEVPVAYCAQAACVATQVQSSSSCATSASVHSAASVVNGESTATARRQWIHASGRMGENCRAWT